MLLAAGVVRQTPRFNLMGDTHDLRHAVRHIVDKVRRERPGSPIFLAGISAGSGLLVRYLGEEGPESPFMAAASLCPGYDIRVCFRRVHPLCELCQRELGARCPTPERPKPLARAIARLACPAVDRTPHLTIVCLRGGGGCLRGCTDDRALLQRFKEFFVLNHAAVHDGITPKQREALLAARSVHEFMIAAAPLSRTDTRVRLDSYFLRGDADTTGSATQRTPPAGDRADATGACDAAPLPRAMSDVELAMADPVVRTAFEDYMSRCNPMEVAHLITTPLLVVNAADDPVCVASNIPTGAGAEELVANGTQLLAVTARGRFVAPCHTVAIVCALGHERELPRCRRAGRVDVALASALEAILSLLTRVLAASVAFHFSASTQPPRTFVCDQPMASSAVTARFTRGHWLAAAGWTV